MILRACLRPRTSSHEQPLNSTLGKLCPRRRQSAAKVLRLHPCICQSQMHSMHAGAEAIASRMMPRRVNVYGYWHQKKTFVRKGGKGDQSSKRGLYMHT